jgi:hypothetical protein
LKTVTNIADHRVSWIKARPMNCDAKLKEEHLCPDCKQAHLRPGYCQALDPINAGKYPQLHQQKRANTLANVLTDDANADDDKAERRKVYQRELMRKRRAEGK